MKPLLFDRAPLRAEPSLVEAGKTFSELLADLAMRMSIEQRVAFLAKMASMDRQLGELSPASVTFGRA